MGNTYVLRFPAGSDLYVINEGLFGLEISDGTLWGGIKPPSQRAMRSALFPDGFSVFRASEIPIFFTISL